MGGILSGASNAKQQKAVGALQFQTSQHGGVIPLVYGTTRVSPNLIDYDDFTATPSARQGGAGKGGGGGKGGGQQYKYSASVIMGLCQGPIAGIGAVWWDKNIGMLSSLPAAVYLGSDGQAADPYWETNHADKALGYSGTATIVANNFAMGNTATLPNFSFEVEGLLSLSGTNGFDANPAAIVTDFLSNPRYGAGFPATNLGDLSLYSAYCQALGLVLSPMLDTQQEAQQHLADIVNITNSAIVWSGGLLKIIPYGDQPVTGNGATYTPNTIPLYSLGEDDFIVQESTVGTNSGVTPGGPALRSGSGPITGGFSDDPVHITRSTPADASNSIQLECLDRSNNYNTAIVEAFDQGAIDLFGIRRNSSLKARAIVDPLNVGPIVAQLLLQRALLFRNTYTFKLGWKYCLLEPMDLVEITDLGLGALALVVRITAVEEDDEGTLSISAEDFFGGYSTAVVYPKQSSLGYVPNWNSPPGDVNAPIIFEPPAALLTSGLEIWVALSGGTNWGGAQVWISSDGNSYALAGTVNSSAVQGVLTADLPPHSSPDLTNTLSVDLTESQGQLASVSTADAANLVTLCYVGGELLAYQTATLTAASKYTLTTLYRGAYGSTITDHSPGALFARLDGSIGRFSYPNTLIGQTIYLKFASMNIVGGGLQNLSSLPVYTYEVKGTGQASSIIVSGSFSGRPTASLVLQSYVFAGPVTLPAGLSGSRATAATAATASTTFNIQKNGANIGTMVFAPSAAPATFTINSATLFNAGDVLSLVAPSAPDATLGNLAWTIMGNRQ
ncbi:MAG: phage tail protein [Alphaproteobacteria bacterium]|nr:phage tail protein [Alphaproteobacteria bacterium]